MKKIFLVVLLIIACNKDKPEVANPHEGMDMADLASIPGHEGHEELFQSKGFLSKQIKNLEKAREKNLQDIGIMIELSRAYIHGNEEAKAVPLLRKAYEIDPKNSEVVYNLAVILASLGTYPEALQILELYIRVDSSNVRILALLADTYRNMNNYEKAIEAYEKLLSLNPEDRTARYNSAVSTLISKNDVGKALAYLSPLEKNRELLSSKDSSVRLLMLLKEVHKRKPKLVFKDYLFNKQLGNVKFDEGNFVEAIGYYAKAINSIPFDATTLIDQGICYRKIGDFMSAEKAFQSALKIEGKHPEALYNLGIVAIFDLGKKDEGIAYWQKLLKTDPYFAGTEHLKDRISEVINPL